MFNKDYFLARLEAGENLQTIGETLAAMMNEAEAEYQAKIQKQKELEAQRAAEAKVKADKIKMIGNIIDSVKGYAALLGLDEEILNELKDENAEELVEAFDEVFNMIAATSHLTKAKIKATPTPAKVVKFPTADDDKLAKFLSDMGFTL